MVAYTGQLHRAIYGSRPHDEEDRANMKVWNDKEKECDEHNATMFLAMDKTHLNKTREKGFIARIKANSKYAVRQAKMLNDYKKMPNSGQAIKRTWIQID